MTNEEKIVEKILERFPFLDGQVSVQRRQRVITNGLPKKQFEEVLKYVHSDMGFDVFHLVIGVDDGDDLGFVYALSDPDRVILMLKQTAPKSNPVIKSVCDIYPNALWHERDLVDLFGAVVEELPPGPNYPLPDNWPEGNYPLRKEWKVEYFDQETMTYNPPAPNEEDAEAKEVAKK